MVQIDAREVAHNFTGKKGVNDTHEPLFLCHFSPP